MKIFRCAAHFTLMHKQVAISVFHVGVLRVIPRHWYIYMYCTFQIDVKIQIPNVMNFLILHTYFTRNWITWHVSHFMFMKNKRGQKRDSSEYVSHVFKICWIHVNVKMKSNGTCIGNYFACVCAHEFVLLG